MEKKLNIVDTSYQIIENFKVYLKHLKEFDIFMEEVYSKTGQILPQMEKKITEESIEAQTMLDYLLSGVSGTGVIDSIQEIEKSLKKNTDRVQEYVEKYVKISANMLARLESLSHLNKMINKMQVLANEIKIFSVNSVIISSRAGKDGMGFKSISHFIIELSEEINQTAQHLGQYTEAMMKIYYKIKEKFSYLFNEIYDKKLKKMNTAINLKIEESVKTVKEIYRILNEVIKRINSPLKKIPEIMKNIQNQDIIRQSFEHIVEIFHQVIEENDIKKKLNIEEKEYYFCIYVHFVMQKLHKDFNNTNILTQKTNTSIKDHFQQLYHEFLTIEEDKEEIVSYLSNTDFYRDKENVLEKLFGELKTAFLSYENVLMEEMSTKKSLIQLFEELEKVYHEGFHYFSMFKKFYDRMNNINILAQIEINKKSFAGKNSSAIRQKFNTMLEYFHSFKEEIKDTVERNFSSLIVELKVYSSQKEEEEGFILENINFLKKNTLEISSFQTIIRESLSSVLSSGNKILSVVKNSLDKMDVLDNMSRKMQELILEIETIVTQFNSDLEKEFSEKNYQMKNFYQNNYFIEKMKKSRVNLEKHIEASGEVELF
ncbi:MAG TPA: hypothetical protein DHW82_07855 [Spirochaetia bacterium]|nr:hypothetical protein [Spirochaetia bacterium]